MATLEKKTEMGHSVAGKEAGIAAAHAAAGRFPLRDQQKWANLEKAHNEEAVRRRLKAEAHYTTAAGLLQATLAGGELNSERKEFNGNPVKKLSIMASLYSAKATAAEAKAYVDNKP